MYLYTWSRGLSKKRLKTVIRGEDDPAFEELNILKPNLSWSPDGRKIVLSTKSKGFDEIAIIDYQSTEVEKISMPELDAIGSVSWSPDGTKLAFDGNIGPYQDIFMYDLNEKQLTIYYMNLIEPTARHPYSTARRICVAKYNKLKQLIDYALL